MRIKPQHHNGHDRDQINISIEETKSPLISKVTWKTDDIQHAEEEHQTRVVEYQGLESDEIKRPNSVRKDVWVSLIYVPRAKSVVSNQGGTPICKVVTPFMNSDNSRVKFECHQEDFGL